MKLNLRTLAAEVLWIAGANTCQIKLTSFRTSAPFMNCRAAEALNKVGCVHTASQPSTNFQHSRDLLLASCISDYAFNAFYHADSNTNISYVQQPNKEESWVNRRMGVTVFQHQFYLKHMLLTELGFYALIHFTYVQHNIKIISFLLSRVTNIQGSTGETKGEKVGISCNIPFFLFCVGLIHYTPQTLQPQ